MLRGLLRDREAAKALFEKVVLFKSPELLEKYVIASEVTVEVLDVFLSRVFGTERPCISNESGDLKALWESLGCCSLSEGKEAASGDLSARADEHMEGLRVKVQDLERQLCAVQRQLQMQGEVSQLAVSLDSKLDQISRECERSVSGVRSQVSAVSDDVAGLKEEVRDKASTRDVISLSKDVSCLKESEKSLGDRISDVAKAMEAERALRDELQREIERLDAVVMRPVDPLNGIIAQLTRECGGNVHKKGVVEVTASSVYPLRSGRQPENAVDLGTNSFFTSNDESSPWLRYDFKGRRVTPERYSIRSANQGYPRSWVLEVSNSGSEGSWEIVNRRENNEDLKGNYVTHNFAISAPPRGAFRFVRVRQTGENHEGNDRLYISSLELFGTLSSQ